MSEVITKQNESIVNVFALIDKATRDIDSVMRNYRPALYGERYITGRELMIRLKISKRTLQQWRSDGVLSYCIIGGKTLYRESDIQAVLENHFHNAFR